MGDLTTKTGDASMQAQSKLSSSVKASTDENRSRTYKEPKNGLKKHVWKCAVVTGLAIVLVGAYAYGRNSGQSVVMADSFIDKVAGTATDKIDDALTDEIAQKVVEEQVNGIVTKDFVAQAVKEQLGDSVPATVQDHMTELITDAVNSKVTEVLSSQQNFLSDGQREEVQSMISTAIKEKLGNKDVSSITQEDLDALKAEIENGMSSSVKQLLSSSTVQFSPQTIESLKSQLNLTDVVNNALDSSGTVLKQSEIQTIKESIIQQLQTNTKTPVKGKDYLTSAEIMTIEKNAADKATASITGDVTGVQSSLTSLTGSVNSVKENVDNLTEQMNALNSKQSDSLNQANNNLTDKIDANKNAANKAIADNKAASDKVIADNKAASDKADAELNSEITANKNAANKAISELSDKTDASVTNINENITNINENITNINESASDLASQVCIKNHFLRRVTAKHGSIDRAEVIDTSSMTVAEFVDVLAGNEVQYTAAINQLSDGLRQVQATIGTTFTQLSEQCASLSELIDLNGDNVASFQDALLKESENREEAIRQATQPLNSNIADIKNKLDAYKQASEAANADATQSNKKALEDAKRDLNDSLSAYQDTLSGLTGSVKGLDASTKNNISDMQKLISESQQALADNDSSLDSKIKLLNDKTTITLEELNGYIQREQEAREKADEQLNGTISGVKSELNDTISSAITKTNATMEEYNEAQKKYTEEKTDANKKALEKATEDLTKAQSDLAKVVKGNNDAISIELKKQGESLLQQITTVVQTASNNDQWKYNLVLSSSEDSDGSSIARTVNTSSQGASWVLTEENTGIKNFTETSDVTIQYAEGTPDCTFTYNQEDGKLIISIGPDFYSMCNGNITISSIHVMTENKSE